MNNFKMILGFLMCIVFAATGCAVRVADGARAMAPDGTCSSLNGDDRDRAMCLEAKLEESKLRERDFQGLLNKARSGGDEAPSNKAQPAVAPAGAFPMMVPPAMQGGGFMIPVPVGPYATVGKSWFVLVMNRSEELFADIPAGLAPLPDDMALFQPIRAQRRDGSIATRPMIPPGSEARLVPVLETRGPGGMPLVSGLGVKQYIFEMYSRIGDKAVLASRSMTVSLRFPKTGSSTRCPFVNQCISLDALLMHDVSGE